MERSDPPSEAWQSESVSRSVSEPDSASLCELRAAKLPYGMKPATGGEVRGESNRRALRGGWGQRMEKDQQARNLGDPAKWTRFFLGTNAPGEYLTLGGLRWGVGPAHISGEAGNDRGAKGLEQRRAEGEEGRAAGMKIPLRDNRRPRGGCRKRGRNGACRRNSLN